MSRLLHSTLAWLGQMLVYPRRRAVMVQFPGEPARQIGIAHSDHEAEGIYIRVAYKRLREAGLAPASNFWTEPLRGGR